MSYREKGIIRRGYVTYEYLCPGCKKRGDMDVIRDHEGPLPCPHGCGTMLYQSNSAESGLPELTPVKTKSWQGPPTLSPKPLIRRDVTTRQKPVVRDNVRGRRG
jgi:hypothetical protein